MKKIVTITVVLLCCCTLFIGCKKKPEEQKQTKEGYSQQVNKICEEFGEIHTKLQAKLAQVDLQTQGNQFDSVKEEIGKMNDVLEKINQVTPIEEYKRADESLKKAGQYYKEGLTLLTATMDTYYEKQETSTYEERLAYQEEIAKVHEKFGLANNELYSVVVEMKNLEDSE